MSLGDGFREAMLALGQRTSVLHLLDRIFLTDVAASRGLLITRGKLRPAANRCAEGIGDFDLVLTEARRPQVIYAEHHSAWEASWPKK
jgi:hypothetical protein